MNWKRLVSAAFAGFVFMFLFGFVWNGKLMHFAYDEAITLWRDRADMPILILGYLVVAFFIAIAFARFISRGGAWAGFRLGMTLAFINVGGHFITFAVQPLTLHILWLSIIGTLVQFTVAGAIIGAIYKPGASESATV